MKEFKEFAVKGNALDMAVGVIIGGAFGKIVTSLVNDIIMPPIGALIGNTNFTDLKIDLSRVRDVASNVTSVLGEKVTATGTEMEPIYWRYGAFIQQVIDFTILAFCVVPDGQADQQPLAQEGSAGSCPRSRTDSRAYGRGETADRNPRPAQGEEISPGTIGFRPKASPLRPPLK